MIERLHDLPAGVDGLRARGKVTKHDYDESVQPLLDEARREGRRIRLLYHFPPEFEGFSAGAAWEDARIGLHHLRLFERCAIVTDVGWLRAAARVVGSMMPCPTAVYPNADWERALAWLTSATAGEVVAHRLVTESGVLVIEPDRALRAADFEAIALTVDPWIEAHGELKGLVIRAREFPGWENLGSFLRHIRFVRDHHRKVRRIALAADGRIAQILPRLAEHFVGAEVERFTYSQLDDAVAWASGDQQ